MTYPYRAVFLDFMNVERHASPLTLTAYDRDLKYFFDHSPLFDSGSLISFIKDQQALALSAVTIARRISALRTYGKFLIHEGYMDHDPTRILERPKQGRRLPKILDENAIDAMIQATHDMPLPERYRLISMVELMYASGMRVTELVTLKLEQVMSLKKEGPLCFIIKGKRSKERMVPITPSAFDALRLYIKVRPYFSKEKTPWLYLQ